MFTHTLTICESGIMSPPIDQLTQEGFDMTFGTNVIGPYLFTTLLMPALLATAAETGEARIVNTSSLWHMVAPKPCISWETLGPFDNAPENDKKRQQLGADALYYQSKCVSAPSQTVSSYTESFVAISSGQHYSRKRMGETLWG